MAEKKLTAAQQQALSAAGFPWDKLKNLPWAQLLVLLQAFLDALLNKQAPKPVMGAAPAGEHECSLTEHLDHQIALADMQAQLAACSKRCAEACKECCAG